MDKIKTSKVTHIKYVLLTTILFVLSTTFSFVRAYAAGTLTSTLQSTLLGKISNQMDTNNPFISSIDSGKTAGVKKQRIEIVTHDTDTQLTAKQFQDKTKSIILKSTVDGKNLIVSKKSIDKTASNNDASLQIELPDDAIYVINGKLQENGNEDFKKIDVNNIKSITIFKENTIVAKYVFDVAPKKGATSFSISF